MLNDTFIDERKENTLNFLSFINKEGMSFERIYGYWKNQYYWKVKYNNFCVCYILLNGTGDENQFAPFTIWTDDSGSECYRNYPIDEEKRILAWQNIDYCVNCKSCSGGTNKIIFGKEFCNVCRTEMRFTNPNKEGFEFIKVLLDIRKNYIQNQIVNFSRITACGECCGKCKKYMEGICKGCIETDGYVSEWAKTGRCKVHACTREHGAQFCGLCSEFPCKELTNIVYWNSDVIEHMKYLAKVYDNIEK